MSLLLLFYYLLKYWESQKLVKAWASLDGGLTAHWIHSPLQAGLSSECCDSRQKGDRA